MPDKDRFCIPCQLVLLPVAENLSPDAVLLTWNARSQYNQLDDKIQWPKNRNFKYASTTGGTNLRSHLERFHLAEYLKIGQERGWVMQLASIKAKAKELEAARLLLKKQVPFSPDNVTKYLIRFIVGNDQVILTLLKVNFIILLKLFSTVYKCG